MSKDWPDWETTYERKIEEEARRKKRMSRRLSARLTKDRWFCDACNCWHPKKQECPKSIERIVDHVERSLAHAYGQRDSYVDAFITELATDINRAAQYDDCGARTREHFLRHPELGRYILLVADRVCPHHWDDSELSDKQKTLVCDHLPLASMAARQYAPTNGVLRDELRTRAIEELSNLIHLWDPNRGVTFGAFANPRQQAVYRARVLADPPVPRDELARQLRIRDPTQVSRILRQAERNVARILKVSPLKRI